MGEVIVVIVIVDAIICGILSGWLASTKNRNAVGWLLGGLLVGPIALIAVGLSPTAPKQADVRTATPASVGDFGTRFVSPAGLGLQVEGLTLTGGGFFTDRELRGVVANRSAVDYEAVDVVGAIYGPADGEAGDRPVDRDKVTLQGLRAGASVPFKFHLQAHGSAAKQPRYTAAVVRVQSGGRTTQLEAMPPQSVESNPDAVEVTPQPGAKTKECPDCAETVLAAARICRYCRHEFVPDDST